MSLTREEIQNEIVGAIAANNEAKRLCNEALCHANNELNRIGLESAEKSSDDYNRGLEDAWEFVKRMSLHPDDGGAPFKVSDWAFGTVITNTILKKYYIHEAMAKFMLAEEEYNKQKRIKIGDCVEVFDKDISSRKGIGIFVGNNFNDDLVMMPLAGFYGEALHYTPTAFNMEEFVLRRVDGFGVDIIGAFDRLIEERR